MSRANRNLRGFLLHDERICFDNLAPNDGAPENSSYEQDAARPGTAAALDGLGTARPHAHNAQPADLSVIALRAGIPKADTGAGFGYRIAGDEAEDTRGWNDPNLVQGYRPVDWSTSLNWQDVHAAVCPRSQKVVVIGRDTGAAVDPTVWVWDPATREWSVGAEVEPDVFVGTAVAILCLKATGRILAMALTPSTGDAVVHFSDDDGDTWAEYSRPKIAAPSATKIRLAEDGNGNILILAVDEATGDYVQSVSTDGLVSFSTFNTGTAFGTDPSIHRLANGRLILTFRPFATGDVDWITLDDAFDLIADQTPAALDNTVMSSAESCVDADGIVYCVMSINASDRVVIRRSVDGGATFEARYQSEILATGASTANPTNHRHLIRGLAPSGGELLALFNSVHTATTPTTDGSLISAILGGWANVEVPTTFGSRTRWSWIFNADGRDLDGLFLPTETLANQGWTHTGTAEALVNGYHQFATSSATSFARVNFAGFADGQAAQLYEVGVPLGGTPLADEISILYLRRNGANEKALRIRIYASGFKVLDDDSTSPSTLATVVADLSAEFYQFLCVWADERRVTVFYRVRSSSVWIQAAQAQLAQTATATATDQLTLGVTVSSTSDVRFGLIAFAGNNGNGLFLGNGLEDDGPFLDRMDFGKALAPGLPYPVRDQIDTEGNMLHLSASGGVARHQERWQIAAEWDRGVRELHPIESPKPTSGWRSTSLAEQIFVWDMQVDTRLGNSWALGAAFIRCNFHQALIEASTDAAPTTWVQIGGYVGIACPLTGVGYTRKGDLLIPSASTAPGSHFYAGGSLRGGHFVLDPFNVPAVCRRILDNQSGGWAPDGAQAVIRIEGLDGTEPASGTGYIVAPSGVVVMHNPVAAYRRYRLRIPEQETPDGHFRLGKFVLGGIFAAGRQWSRGWSWRYVPLTRTEEDDDGTLYVDPRGSEASRSIRRELTVSWQDGYDESRIRNGTAPYLSASDGTPPLVADQDVQFQIAHLLRAGKGGSIPSVVLPEIPPVSRVILDQEMFSFGRLGVDQTWQINNVQGDEGRSTVYRGEGLTHVELV